MAMPIPTAQPTSRRRLLAATALLPASRLSFAATSPGHEQRLVLVILRGGLDGLGAVPAGGHPGFASARGAPLKFQNATSGQISPVLHLRHPSLQIPAD